MQRRIIGSPHQRNVCCSLSLSPLCFTVACSPSAFQNPFVKRNWKVWQSCRGEFDMGRREIKGWENKGEGEDCHVIPGRKFEAHRDSKFPINQILRGDNRTLNRLDISLLSLFLLSLPTRFLCLSNNIDYCRNATLVNVFRLENWNSQENLRKVAAPVMKRSLYALQVKFWQEQMLITARPVVELPLVQYGTTLALDLPGRSTV